MSVALVVAVVALVVGAVVLPFMLLKGLVAHIRHGGRLRGGWGRDPGDYRDKTQEDLEQRTLERVEGFLDKHDFSYERDREFSAGGEAVMVPFYLTERETGILLDDWYTEYLVAKHLGFSTVIVEPHTTEEYQYETLRVGLGVERDWRDAVEWGDGAAGDAEVLGLELEEAGLEDVREAYRDRILETHPDRNDSPKAEEEFKRVREAYENLRSEFESAT